MHYRASGKQYLNEQGTNTQPTPAAQTSTTSTSVLDKPLHQETKHHTIFDSFAFGKMEQKPIELSFDYKTGTAYVKASRDLYKSGGGKPIYKIEGKCKCLNPGIGLEWVVTMNKVDGKDNVKAVDGFNPNLTANGGPGSKLFEYFRPFCNEYIKATNPGCKLTTAEEDNPSFAKGFATKDELDGIISAYNNHDTIPSNNVNWEILKSTYKPAICKFYLSKDANGKKQYDNSNFYPYKKQLDTIMKEPELYLPDVVTNDQLFDLETTGRANKFCGSTNASTPTGSPATNTPK